MAPLTPRTPITRLLLSLALAACVSGQNRASYAHPGHDHAPEAPTQAPANLAPRFYARSDAFEAVLVFPDPGEKGDPTLYLARTDDSSAVAGAQITAEILAPVARKLDASPAALPGTYALHGLDVSKTTASLSLDVSAGDLSDFLTFDNVTAAGVSTAAGEHGGVAAQPGAAGILRLPRYLFWALASVAGILAATNLLVAWIWLARLARSRRRAASGGVATDRRPGSRTATGQHVGLLLLLLFGGPIGARGHGGEDHSGASLATSSSQQPGSGHFVPIDTQFQADIRTTRVAERVLPLSMRALGQVEVRPDLMADVTPPVQGRLKLPTGATRVPIAGATVGKGDVLAVVEQLIAAGERATLANDRAQVEAELAQAQQELALAERNAERANRLAKVIARKEVDDARSALKIAQDRVTGFRNRLATLTTSLSTTAGSASAKDVPVLAPISGVIAESHATTGEYVSPDKRLFEIVNLDDVFVEAEIFESDVAAVQGAATARITVEAYPGRTFQGSLSSLGQQVDPQKRTLKVRFNVDNPGHLLRGGMFANVDIESGQARPMLLVPKTALFSQDGVRQVFRRTAPETYVATPVELSGFRDEFAVVAGGIKKDDRVAVSGLYQIRMSPTVGGGK